MSRTVIVTGGGDWTDASVEQVVVADWVNMTAAHNRYRLWIAQLPPYGPERSHAWLSFVNWLKKHANATDGTLEIFHED